MLKKRILILCVFIFAITLITQVKSYTLAKVENSAVVTVTSSEKALIAVPDKIDLDVTKNITETITQTLNDLGEPIIEKSIDIEIIYNRDKYIVIKNNLNKNINKLSVYLDGKYEGIVLENNANRSVPSGETLKDIIIEINENVQTGSQKVGFKILASWDGGFADINSMINLNVNKNESTVNIDLATPNLNSNKLNEPDTGIELINELTNELEESNNSEQIENTNIEQVKDSINDIEEDEEFLIPESISPYIQNSTEEDIQESETNALNEINENIESKESEDNETGIEQGIDY